MARVGYDPDSFGGPATLPQVYIPEAKDAYVFMLTAVARKEFRPLK